MALVCCRRLRLWRVVVDVARVPGRRRLPSRAPPSAPELSTGQQRPLSAARGRASVSAFVSEIIFGCIRFSEGRCHNAEHVWIDPPAAPVVAPSAGLRAARTCSAILYRTRRAAHQRWPRRRGQSANPRPHAEPFRARRVGSEAVRRVLPGAVRHADSGAQRRDDDLRLGAGPQFISIAPVPAAPRRASTTSASASKASTSIASWRRSPRTA